MFNIIVDGETVETVMYGDVGDMRRYIREEYESHGIKPKFQKIGD